MKRPAPMARKLSARELVDLIEPPRTALTRLWLGVAGEADYHLMALGINVGHLIAQRVQRHSANVPYMLRGAAAANAGWADVPAVDAAIQLFAAMVRTTNRRTLLAVYTQAVADATPSSTPPAGSIECNPSRFTTVTVSQ
jgi:hypothetical protein